MTQEEYNELVERCEKGRIIQFQIDRISSHLDKVHSEGLRISTGGWDGHSINEVISQQLNDRITQMVIDALNAKREELQKEFDKL